ncbi:ArsA-related P-loop ATPase [Streptomyces sp. NPDC058045]|uniref:ArsA family ATPase n=1 Tax=Streptomyces sp. NPDC058045 TaxID=3346311 RepID=UPI0036E75E73
MRTVLLTGPAGAGRSTLAAATALAAARAGRRTLLLSADPEDTPGAALGTPTGDTPVTAAPGLTVLRPDTAARFRTGLLRLQDQAAPVLDLLGAARLDDEELTPLPGAAELALLHALHEAAAGPYELLVVDLPATAEALAALARPAQLRRYLRRLLPAERQVASALRPVLGRLAGVPVPTDRIYAAAQRWDLELAAVQGVLADPETTVRLVAEPGPAAADALHTATAGLALYGLRVDGLLANRVLPDEADGWLAGPVAQQRKALDGWRAAADAGGTGAVPVRTVRHLGRDPRGTEDLAALDVPAPPAAPPPVTWPVADRRAEDGVLVWRIPLPGARREELGLVRRGDELVVTVGAFRRIVELPSALRRCTVVGAGLRDGELGVRFRPDPDLWPRRD